MGVLGGILLAVSINLFVVPQGMYSGGLYGLCQVIRTLVVDRLGVKTSVDLAGVLYLLVNLPLIALAWRTLGRGFVIRMTVVTVVNSIALAVIPSPAAPIIADKLTSCLVAGILSASAARSAALRLRSTPSCSTASPVSRMPAVSVSRSSTWPSSNFSSTVSRVVPATSVTMARS